MVAVICLLAFVVGYWVGVLRPPDLVFILSGGTEPAPKPKAVINPAPKVRRYYRHEDYDEAIAEAEEIMGLGDE